MIFGLNKPPKKLNNIVNFLTGGSSIIIVLLGMLSIVLLGTGNVAWHLFNVFRHHRQLEVVQVVGRNNRALKYFEKEVKTATNLNAVIDADIYIIAVSDDAILSVSEQLMAHNKLVVHTSGSAPINAISKKNRPGVFYPLQSFSKDSEINFNKVPVCIEASNKEDLKILKLLAATVSKNVYEISTEQRRSLHLAAVFVNNFTNHMYVIGDDICRENKLQFSMLQPLIQETCKKLERMPPHDAQTGPARRNDKGTMKNHLQLLENEDHREIYSLLSRSIWKTREEQ